MTTQDPTTHSDPTQGKIKHIDFIIKVDFDANILDIEATYQLDKPFSGTLLLDSYKIDLKQAQANGRALTWELDLDDEVVGQRLQLRGLDGFAGDPFAGLGLSSDGFAAIGRNIATGLNLPTLIVQEGGYLCDELGQNLRGFLQEFQ